LILRLGHRKVSYVLLDFGSMLTCDMIRRQEEIAVSGFRFHLGGRCSLPRLNSYSFSPQEESSDRVLRQVMRLGGKMPKF
jgi:hypothetical protein